jgi:hypothetical protein
MQCAFTTELQAILRGIVTTIRHASEIVQLGARLAAVLEFSPQPAEHMIEGLTALPEGSYAPTAHTSHTPSRISGLLAAVLPLAWDGSPTVFAREVDKGVD